MAPTTFKRHVNVLSLTKSHTTCPGLPSPGSLLFHAMLHSTGPLAASVLSLLLRMLFPWI